MHNLVTRFGFKFPPNTFNEQINTQEGGGGGGGRRGVKGIDY